MTVFEWLASDAERVIETSCAWVFLQGDRALKLKKPVDYGFLDFSTPAKRRWALERELAFNRVTAPDPVICVNGGSTLAWLASVGILPALIISVSPSTLCSYSNNPRSGGPDARDPSA